MALSRWLAHLTIGRKLVFGFLALLLGAFFSFGYFVFREQERAIESYARQEATNEAAVIAGALTVKPLRTAAVPLFQNTSELQNYAEAFYAQNGRDIIIVDRDRTVLADWEPWNVGTKFPHFSDPDGSIQSALEKTLKHGTSEVFVERSEDGVFELVSVPIRSAQGEILGAVLLEYSSLYEHSLAEIERLEEHLTWVALGIAFIACVLARGMAEHIVRPLRIMTRAAQKLGAGDLAQRVPVKSYDETGVLAQAFNAMAEQLAETTISKTELQQELEARKQILAMLRDSEETYRALFHSSTDGCFLMTDVLFDCNEALCRMLACTRDEIIGRRPDAFSPPRQPDGRDYASDSREHLPLVRNGAPQHIAWQIRRHDGTLFDAEIALVAVKVGGKDIIQGTVRDVTARLRAEQQSQDYTAALEAATKAKSEFLANMSHEIRTPMTAILGYADLLLENLHTPQDVDAVVTIQRNGEHLLRIINDILDLSKVEAGKMAIEHRTCSPHTLLLDTANLMRVRAQAKNLTLTAASEGATPETIQSDPTRVRQILVNLVGNAIKFTEVGGVALTMGLAPNDGRAPQQMWFRISDTGCGIAPELAAKLFQPFSQGDNSSQRNHGGTGLGLTISQRLAEALGGGITFESVPGRGSVFTLTINTGPLQGVKMIDAAPLHSESPGEADAPAPRAKMQFSARVLLAEDGRDNQRLLDFMLKRAGVKTRVVENGALAVSAALAAQESGKPFDVILMDMQMPIMDGYTATRQLRSAGYTAPIIALTAHAMSDDRQQCLDAGCDAYVTKPIDRQHLLTIVRQFAIQRSWQEPSAL